MTTYLTVDDLMVIAAAMLGERLIVRDYGLLAGAAHRPETTVFGEDAYSTVHHKAAALLQSLVSSHPLVDGNKRLGWAACLVFYDLNGFSMVEDEDRHVAFVMSIADGSRHEVDEIASSLVTWAVAKPASP